MKLPKIEKVKSMAASAGSFFCYDVNIYEPRLCAFAPHWL